MKKILVACIISALTIVAVESLMCVKCNSFTNNCDNSNVTECPMDVGTSCTSSLVNSTLGIFTKLYLDKSCSVEDCTEEEKVVAAFTVHVSDREHFQFASHCCQGDICNTNNASVPSLEVESSNIQCPACYGSDEASCTVTSRKCYQEEQCVDMVVHFKNVHYYHDHYPPMSCTQIILLLLTLFLLVMLLLVPNSVLGCHDPGGMDTSTETLVLKGCANISNSTCQLLSVASKTIGGITFQKFQCEDNPTTPTTTPSVSTDNVSSATTPPQPTTPSSPQITKPNTGSKVSLTPFALASLLLLGLLL